ncbi:Serine/threonine-protein kinase HSL1 [Leucoagaricus sp. SymC.cos]|nr:Serine/threonine-protein kinase HSL1 [Leucoagaricus sp. SymC.cos]
MASLFPSQQQKFQDPKMIGQWKVGRTIGRGCSGRVRIARHSKTGQYAAIKIISKSSLTASHVSLNRLAEEVEREKLAVEREIVVMKLIDHPNIMHLYDVWETSSHLYLILEYIQGGELFEHLCKHGPLSITETLKYFHQIIGAVDYFHRFNVAHRDLKPENILLDHNFNIKIADFGMAAWQINASGTADLMKTSCGSPHYAAPEIIRGEPYMGSAADIWSCGVILYAMLTAQLPFDDDNLPELLDKVTTGKYTIPSFVDPLAHNLIRRMLAVNVKKRITMSEIFTHPFFRLYSADTEPSAVPELSRIAHPLKSKSAIDPDIFANLRTLWNGASDEDLIKSLLNEGRNWQKGIYHLLVNYRAKQAAEDEISEDEMERRRARKAKKVAEKKAKKAAEIILQQHASGNLVTPSCSDDLHPPRAEPPTPRKARGRYFISANDADADTDTARSKSRSDELSHLMLDVRTPRLIFADGTNKLGKVDLNRTLPALPEFEVEGQTPPILSNRGNHRSKVLQPPENVNQLGLSKLSTQAQTGDDDRRDLDSERSTLKQASGQLVFSLGHNTKCANTYMIAAPTRPLSIKRRSQVGTRESRRDTADKENDMDYDGSGNCFINFSDTVALRRKLSLSRRYGCNELGYCTHGRPLGYIDSRRSPHLQHSYFRSDSHPRSGGSGSSSPKRTWLDTIFRSKPSYSTKHTLHSNWDIITTRNECRRLLMNMDIQVQVFWESHEAFTDRDERSSPAVTLKCKMDEMADSTGILGVMKMTKFRVEMRNVRAFGHRAASLSSLSEGDEIDSNEDEQRIAVTLIHEKGSGESFREIVRRLKKEWTLQGGGSVGVL